VAVGRTVAVGLVVVVGLRLGVAVGLVVGLTVTTAPETIIAPFSTLTGILLPSLSEKEAFSIAIGELPPEIPLKVRVNNTPDPLIGESGLSLVAATPLIDPPET